MKSIKGSSWVMFNSNMSVGHIVIDQVIKRPLSIARAVPEVNGVVRLTSKETSKGMNYSQGVGLTRVDQRINCSSSCT